MTAYSVDTSKQLGGQISRGVRELREATDTVNTLAAVLAEMSDSQIGAFTGFDEAQAATLRTVMNSAVTALNDANLEALRTQLIWL